MINVYPIDDIKEHVLDTTCECCPKIVEESGEMIVVHNSFDFREIVEQAKKIIDEI